MLSFFLTNKDEYIYIYIYILDCVPVFHKIIIPAYLLYRSGPVAIYLGGLGPVANVCRGPKNYSYATAANARLPIRTLAVFGGLSPGESVDLQAAVCRCRGRADVPQSDRNPHELHVTFGVVPAAFTTCFSVQQITLISSWLRLSAHHLALLTYGPLFDFLSVP